MAQLPRISVVIPALNEAACLVRLHQELISVCDPLPYDFEFVSVDDGSTDASEQVLAQLHRADALNELPERHRFLRGLIPWLGFPQTRVEFKAPARWAGRSKYTFRRNIRLALEGITAFSFYPLRTAAAIGGLTMISSLAVGLI